MHVFERMEESEREEMQNVHGQRHTAEIGQSMHW